MKTQSTRHDFLPQTGLVSAGAALSAQAAQTDAKQGSPVVEMPVIDWARIVSLPAKNRLFAPGE